MKPTAPMGETTHPTPSEKLSTLKLEILERLAKIETKVSYYGKGEELNYGHVGSMAYVKEELETIVKFLGI